MKIKNFALMAAATTAILTNVHGRLTTVSNRMKNRIGDNQYWPSREGRRRSQMGTNLIIQ